MKRILAIAALLSLGACAGAPQFKTQYALGSDGNLVERQVQVTDSGACDASGINWCVVGGITVGVLVGIWGLDRIYGDDDPEPAQPFQSPLVPSNGFSTTTTTSEFDTQFITPGYVTVN